MPEDNLTRLLPEIAQSLRVLADSLQAMAEGLEAEVKKNAEPQVVPEDNQPAAEPVISLEAVRAVLAQKSAAGFTAEVKTLIKKFGGTRLSEVRPQDYSLLKEEAEALGNA